MPDPIKRTLQELRSRGAPDFFERDPAALKALFKAEFERLAGRTLYPAQTEMFLVEVAAYAISLLHEAAQTAALQNTAVWADGLHLEDRGANVSTFRLLAQPARTRVRFTLSMARPTNVVVAAGTRIAADAAIIFATDVDLVIAPGQLTGDVAATAVSAGAAAWNGIEPGAIGSLLDPIPFVASVANLTATAGGTDVEDQERYRLRVVNALFTIAKTGPRNGYREHVMAVDPDIVDVAVIRPEPGRINIHPLMRTGIPTAPLKAAVAAYLDPETLRPMGDDVFVLDPVRVGFTFAVAVRCLAAVPGLAVTTEAAVRAAFSPWTQELGAQVAPSVVISAVKAIAGVSDVATDLVFTDLAATAFAGIDVLTIDVVVTPDA